jgi:A/G-specific adenine glycosylase
VIQKKVIRWFEENQRDLPWRNTSPWGVLVSEFMLQQTPVNRVLPIWNDWMNRWPSPDSLAKASKADVIRAWGKLGYPRRALRLYESAKIISTQHNNQVPSTYEELIALPGIGDYTAAAIQAFAFAQSSLVLDINIRRFYSRLYDGIETASSAPSRIERELRQSLIPKQAAPMWAAATMEIGALICTARSPKCGECPVKNSCQWRALEYPKSVAKSKPGFTGSDRQCRGVVMNRLRENPSAGHRDLLALWHDKSQVELALKTLLADGLIETTGKNRYRLPK